MRSRTCLTFLWLLFTSYTNNNIAQCGTLSSTAPQYTLTGPVSLATPLNSFAVGDNTGWTQIHAYNTSGTGNTWSAVQTLPFDFSFFGQPVSQFCVSKNFLLTFTSSLAGTAVNSNIADNTALPSVNLPNNTIAYFWDNFVIPGGGSPDDAIYTRVYGTAPNRQLWIRNHSYATQGVTFSYGMVVLEETSNKIYIIDARNQFAAAGSRTVGIQKNAFTAIQDANSPNIQSINGNVLGDVWPTAKYWVFDFANNLVTQTININTIPTAFTTVTATTGGSGTYTYLWQSSADSTNWVTATGISNLPTYQAVALTATTYFRRKVTDVTCSEVLYDNYRKVIVNGSLPVSLVAFTGSINNGTPALQWKTTREMNTAFFVVERSYDGVQFTEAGRIQAANVAGRHQYSFTDRNNAANESNIIYRLQILDKNGSREYSHTIRLNSTGKPSYSFAPNPAKDHIIITGGNALVEIFDLKGRRLNSQTAASGERIGLHGLLKGMYLVRITDSRGNNVSEKLVIE